MKRNKMIYVLSPFILIILFSIKVFADNKEDLKISGDIVNIKYELKKPIALKKMDKKIDFREKDILNKVSYIDKNSNKKLTEVTISGRDDILNIQKISDDVDIVAEIIRDNKNITLYTKIYDLRNIIWSNECSKIQVVTSINERTKEAKLDWIPYFTPDIIKSINIYKCDMPTVYKQNSEYRITNMDNDSKLIGNGYMNKLGIVNFKVNNLNDIKYINKEEILANGYYMYIENIKTHKITPFRLKEESTESKFFKRITIDDDNFKQVFMTSTLKSGIEGAPIVKNGEFIGSVTNIIKVKNKYIIMAKISE